MKKPFLAALISMCFATSSFAEIIPIEFLVQSGYSNNPEAQSGPMLTFEIPKEFRPSNVAEIGPKSRGTFILHLDPKADYSGYPIIVYEKTYLKPSGIKKDKVCEIKISGFIPYENRWVVSSCRGPDSITRERKILSFGYPP